MKIDLMTRVASGLGLGLLALGLASPARAQDQDPEDAILSRFVGIYDIASGRSAGKELPSDQLQGKVIVTDERMSVVDQDDRELYVLSYDLAGEEAPYRADFEVVASTMADAVGSTAKGLIEAEDSTLRVIYDYEAEGYPEDFETKTDTENRFTLEETVRSKLMGTYTLASGRTAGEEIPEDRLNGRVLITPLRIVSYDADGNELYITRYRFENSKSPYQIWMRSVAATEAVAVGQEARGLIKVEGDTVTLIYDYTSDEYPDGFETDDATQNLFVLKLVSRNQD